MLKRLLIACGTLCLCVIGSVQSARSENRDLAEIQNYLQNNGLPATTLLISNQMALSMPMQIDAFTRLSKVNFQYPDTIVVFVNISLSREQIEELSSLEEIADNMRTDTLSRACSEPVIEAMIRAGMKLTHRYIDSNKQSLFTVSAETGNCLKIGSLVNSAK